MTAQTQPEALQMAIRSMIQEAARQRARIAELEVELMREAQRTAAEKLRADQMTEQHRMSAAMNAEARGELAQLREKRQPLTDEEIENVVQRCGGLWSGDYWIIEDADLHPIARTFAAHNITGEPA